MSADNARVAVAPSAHPWHEEMCAAVRRGGGTLSALEEAQGLIWLGKHEEDLREVLHPGIRWVQLRSAGIENWAGQLDLDRTFTSARGIYAETVAEHALALLFAAARRLPANARASTWAASEQRTGRVLRGSTIALVGAGGIGEAVIRGLAPFDVRILAVTRSGREVPSAAASLAASDVAEVWPVADYVVLTAPATPETKHLIGAAELAAMQPHAWVVNVGRGSLIDTEALVSALRTGAIGGAALDVTEPEPLPDGHALWSLPHVLITPHVANPGYAQLERLAQHVQDNVRRFAEDGELLGVVDVEAGY